MVQEAETPRSDDAAALLAARQQAMGLVLPQGVRLADQERQRTVEPAESVVADMEVPQELAAKAQELQARVNRSPDKARAAQQARSELVGLIEAYNAKESNHLAEEKAHVSHKEEMARHHRELYANDHEYRAATDANMKQADGLLSGFDQQQAQLQALGKQHGISSPLDEEVAKQRREYEDAVRRGDHLAAMQALADMHATAQKQAEEYAQRLRDAGQHAAADQAAGIGHAMKDGFDAAMGIFDKQMAEHMAALRRQLARDGLTPEEERRLQTTQRKINENRRMALETRDAGLLDELADEYMRQKTRNSPLEADGAREVVSKLSPATLSMLPALGVSMQGAYAEPKPAILAAAEEPASKYEFAEATTGEKPSTTIVSVRPAIKNSGMTPVS